MCTQIFQTSCFNSKITAFWWIFSCSTGLLNFLNERTINVGQFQVSSQSRSLCPLALQHLHWFYLMSVHMQLPPNAQSVLSRPAATNVLVRKYSLCCSLCLCCRNLKAQTCPGLLQFFNFHLCRPATMIHTAKMVPASLILCLFYEHSR